jgi:hypothetical protein
MDKLKHYKNNADACLERAQSSESDPLKKRYERLAEGWTALADMQSWLDGQPVRDLGAKNAA